MNHLATPRPPFEPTARRALGAGLLPLGALAAGFAMAQPVAEPHPQPTPPPPAVLPVVSIQASSQAPQGKDTLQPGTTRLGKGEQAVKDLPQSITVLTERLMNDRNLDDFKEVLRSTAGVTFQAGETGEEGRAAAQNAGKEA